MPLVLLDGKNFEHLVSQWEAQCIHYDEILDDFSTVSMSHAKGIIHNAGDPAYKDYSIFAAKIDEAFECILHVNRAKLPQTDGVTQKVMWVLLAPKYDFGAYNPDDVARIAVEVVFGALELCEKEGVSRNIKIHMGNLADREFFAGAAHMVRSSRSLRNVEIKGNWLHMSI